MFGGAVYIIDPYDFEPEEGEEGLEDYDEGDYDGGCKIIESFAEYAAKAKATDVIATTEY